MSLVSQVTFWPSCWTTVSFVWGRIHTHFETVGYGTINIKSDQLEDGGLSGVRVQASPKGDDLQESMGQTDSSGCVSIQESVEIYRSL